jgi:hypothetical protein
VIPLERENLVRVLATWESRTTLVTHASLSSRYRKNTVVYSKGGIVKATGHSEEHTMESAVQKRRKNGYSLRPRLHSKPPETSVTDPTTPRTPGPRVLQALIFRTHDLDPTLYPRHGFGGLLPSGGVIGSNVSEHFLRYNRFETHRSWVSRLLVGFIFHKHGCQQICVMGGVWIFERSFGRRSLV